MRHAFNVVALTHHWTHAWLIVRHKWVTIGKAAFVCMCTKKSKVPLKRLLCVAVVFISFTIYLIFMIGVYESHVTCMLCLLSCYYICLCCINNCLLVNCFFCFHWGFLYLVFLAFYVPFEQLYYGIINYNIWILYAITPWERSCMPLSIYICIYICHLFCYLLLNWSKNYYYKITKNDMGT